MSEETTVYEERGVPRVINGVGTRTQVSGARLRPEAATAMTRAADAHVYMTDLQAHASDVITDAVDAEAAMVTAGTTAGLTLATAACLAGDDYGVMQRLPHPEPPNEVVIPRAHRCKYDVAFRAAGARLRGVGPVSHHPVEGGTDLVRPWQIADAIDERTVAVAYLSRPYNRLPLEDVVEVAHGKDVPVIVDAADETHPPGRMSSFFERGADLVAFSGGKRIRGPQSTGILAGRGDLIRSAVLQSLSDGYHRDVWSPPKRYVDPDRLPGVPPNGIGRGMKVDTEDVIGLLAAFESFLEEDHDAVAAEHAERAERIADRLAAVEGIDPRMTDGETASAPSVIARLDPSVADATSVVRSLRRERPRVWVGEARVHLNELTVSPICLTDAEAKHLTDRVACVVGAAGG